LLLGLHLDILHGNLGLYNRNHMHGHVPLVFMLLWMQQLFVVLWCRGRRELLMLTADWSLLKYHGLLDSNLLHYKRLPGLWRGRGSPLHTVGFRLCMFGLMHGCRLRNNLLNHVWSAQDWLQLWLLRMAVMAICVLHAALWRWHELLLLLRHQEVRSNHLRVPGACLLLGSMLLHGVSAALTAVESNAWAAAV
jgi:hypothetical protein